MIKSKFKKLIAAVSAAAMVATTLVPVVMASTEQNVQPLETAYISGVDGETGTVYTGETVANYSKPNGDGTAFEHGDSNNVGKAALVKFDLSEYVGRISSATLSLHSACMDSGKNSEVNVASIGTDWDAGTVTWADQTGIGPISALGALGFAGSDGADFQYDVTDSVRSDSDGIVAYGFYTSTGRPQQLSNIQLNIVVEDEVLTQTTLTVRNVLADGKVLGTYTVEGLYVGDTYTATAEMIADKELDGVTYTLSADAETSTIVTENGTFDILFEQLVRDIFVNENFNDITGSWGFSGNTGVAVENGALTLCTMTSDVAASDEKWFAEDVPTLADQKEIDVSFKWKTNVDLNAGGGRFSWFSLRDTEGTPILVLVGASNRSALTEVNTQISYGFSETDTKTDFVKIANPNSDFYTVALNLNFNTKVMTGTISDASGEVVATLDRTMEAENLGGLRAYHGLSTSSMSIDDFRVLGARRQNVTFNVQDTDGKALEGVAISIDDQNVVTDVNGAATVSLIANVTYNATLTKALYRTVNQEVVVGEENITVPITMEHVSDEDYVADVISNLDIANGTTVVKQDDVYNVTGDFALPYSNDATITWTTDSTDGQVVVDGTNAVIYPQQDKGTTVVLTATVSYGASSATKSFTLDISDYLSTITAAVDTAAEDATVYPYEDQTGTFGTYGDAEDYTLSGFTADAPLSFDLYLPSSVSGSSALSQDWSSSDSAHLTIDAANNKGAIGADDKDAHEVTLTRTVSYEKNGVTLASKNVEYTVNVQFDPDELSDRIDAWAGKYAATVSEDTSSTAYTNAYNQVYDTFMKQYQLKLDSAYEGNFSNMPEEGTDISTSGISGLNYEGYFGSSIEWTSSQSTYASISKSSGKVNISRSAFSGTRDITITATIYLPSYTESTTRGFTYEITGTRSTGGGGLGTGSTGSTSSTTVMPPATTPMPVVTPAPADQAFDDIESVESWAGDAIRALYSEGIISGKGDNKFAPNDNVTRGEFAKMVVGAFNLNEMPSEYRGFTDVPAGSWCFSYVEIAAAAGVVNGYEDGSFGLNDNITRQDMAVMVVRAAEAAGVSITANGNSAEFGDTGSIADYASAAVDSLVKAGIINGIDGNFEPISNATRAQAAKILANFI